jgi:hypothetical protein
MLLESVANVSTLQKTVSNTQSLAPIIVTSNSEGAQYVTTSYVDGEPISVVVNGTPTVSTATLTTSLILKILMVAPQGTLII